ncbi:MAG: type II toxin-antitoxin system prevent-host-death family antitoxin [Verrucomicrobiota bacterium]
MKVINIQEAKTHLSRLVEEALVGEGIVIAKAGKPLVRLVPVGGAGAPRPLGLLAGQGTESPDCWEPDDEVTGWFYPPQDDTPGQAVAEDPNA